MPENEEKNVQEPTETPAQFPVNLPESEQPDADTPADIAIQMAIKEGYMAHYFDEDKIAAREDQEARDKPDLRIAMVKLIREIGSLIDDTAAEIQHQRSKSEYDPFEVDEIRDVVAWQLAEFITLARYPRNDETYEYIVKGKQFTTDHAAYWFDVLEGYGDPPEFYVQVGTPRDPAPRQDTGISPESDEEGDQDDSEVSDISDTPDDQPDGAPESGQVSE